MDKWYTVRGISFDDLSQALHDARLQWVYAERMEDTVLTWRDDFLKSSIDLAQWSHGRAFGPDAELAWWCRGKYIEMRAIVGTENPPAGITWEPFPTDGWEPVRRDGIEELLIGERDPNVPTVEPQWSTARIPRYMEYPTDGSARRVALIKQAYRYMGVIVAWRLVRVQKVT